jgi:hypothetical protein
MLDFSSLELFARRDLFKGALAAGLLPFGLGGDPDKIPDCPLDIVRRKRFPTLVAIVRAQIDSLWCGKQGDDACQVAREILVYASYLPKRLQQGMNVALLWLDIYSNKHVGRHLHKLGPRDVRRVLNQGENRRCNSDPPRIEWSDDHLLHTAVSGITMLGRLVIHSREPARQWIGTGWSADCENPKHLVSIAPPALANLTTHYDVCVIGSGAGGATAATRLSADGLKVLIVDVGDFVSPDALIQKVPMEDGALRLAPPRSDEVLYRLYKTDPAEANDQYLSGAGIWWWTLCQQRDSPADSRIGLRELERPTAASCTLRAVGRIDVSDPERVGGQYRRDRESDQ